MIIDDPGGIIAHHSQHFASRIKKNFEGAMEDSTFANHNGLHRRRGWQTSSTCSSPKGYSSLPPFDFQTRGRVSHQRRRRNRLSCPQILTPLTFLGLGLLICCWILAIQFQKEEIESKRHVKKSRILCRRIRSDGTYCDFFEPPSSFQLTFDHPISFNKLVYEPGKLKLKSKIESGVTDFGDLVLAFPHRKKPFWFLRSSQSGSTAIERQIQSDKNDSSSEIELRYQKTNFDNEFDPEAAPGDDYLWEYVDRHHKDKEKEEEEGEEEEDDDEQYLEDSPNDHIDVCRRTAEHRLLFPNCNRFHELFLADADLNYLGEGDFRAAAKILHRYGQTQESVVLKHIHYEDHFNYLDHEYMRVDALVAERLTKSPRIYDVYGHCGISILSELFLHGDLDNEAYGDDHKYKEKEDGEIVDDWEPKNDLTPEQKLDMALQMAEAIADLHGYTGGVIVHQDIKSPQFLFNTDETMLKLNDFNMAEFMLWNDKKEEYCRYSLDGRRRWRSPEEFYELSNINEQVDVFNLGTIYYVLLTGRWISDDDANERAQFGEKPHIDKRYLTRSVGEAKLSELIDQCKEYDPDDRPSVFEIIDFLKEAKREIGLL